MEPLITEFISVGMEVNNALQVFKESIANETAAFKGFEIRAMIDHFLSTLFRHYHLYLFCMTNDQEMDQRVCEVEVEVPFVAEKLSKGMEIEKWNYQQSMKKIEEEKETLQTVCNNLLYLQQSAYQLTLGQCLPVLTAVCIRAVFSIF